MTGSWTLTHAQVKGVLDDGDFVVACVLGELAASYHTVDRVGAADCQRMLWQDGRWWIGPGSPTGVPALDVAGQPGLCPRRLDRGASCLTCPTRSAALGGAVGSSIAEAAASAFNTAMKAVWDFAVTLLGGVFAVVDHLSTPDLDPRTGPLASVLPATLWVGGTLLVILSLIQVGKAAISGGTGLLHLFKGIAQYVVVTASGLGLLAGFVTAANAAALGILSSGLHVDSWAGIATANSAWQNTVNAVSGAGLGLIALLGVIPAAISLLVTALVREAAILVIAATIPIVAAGLVAEATARWFWTALRWLLALVLLTPTVAVVMAVGLQLAAGAAGGTQPAGAAASTDAGQSAVTALVGRRGAVGVGVLPAGVVQAVRVRRPRHPLGAAATHLHGRQQHPPGQRPARAGPPARRATPASRWSPAGPKPSAGCPRRTGSSARPRRARCPPPPRCWPPPASERAPTPTPPARVAAAAGHPPARTARPARRFDGLDWRSAGLAGK